MSQPTQSPPRGILTELGAGLVCGLVGLLVAIVPHLALLARFGTWEYVSDWDEILYLSVAKAPYYDPGTWRVTDPFSGPEKAPTIYPSALFAPLAHLTRWLGLGPILMGLVWRTLGGLFFGGALYFLFRRLFSDLRRPWAWALAAALVCLGDSGFDEGRSFIENALILGGHVEGSDFHYLTREGVPAARPNLLGQYRVFNPLLCLPLLLLVAGVLMPERPPGRGLLALGVVAMGGLVLTNFYMWTSATVALGLQGLILFVRGRRAGPGVEGASARVAWRPFAIVLLGGLAIGAPQILIHSWTFAEPMYREIMIRTAKFGRFDWSDPLRWRYLPNSWAWAKLAAGAVAILVLEVRRLGLLWLLVLGGFAMANSVLVLGVDFENPHFHYVYSPFGEILLLAIAVRLACRWKLERPGLTALGLAGVALVASGIAIRADEAIATPKTAELREDLRALGSLRPVLASIEPDMTVSFPRRVRIMALLTPATPLYFSPYTWSSMIPDATLDERHALNAWLQGYDLENYEKLVDQDIERWAHSHYPNEEVWPRRREVFRRILDGGAGPLLQRYRPRYLLRPSDVPEPNRGGPWRLLAHNDLWTLWRRAEAPAAIGEGSTSKVEE